jgi:hypothetical protein
VTLRSDAVRPMASAPVHAGPCPKPTEPKTTNGLPCRDVPFRGPSQTPREPLMRIPTLSKVLLILGMLGVCED